MRKDNDKRQREAIGILQTLGITPNERNLIWYCQQECSSKVTLLLQSGVSPDYPCRYSDKPGIFPLHNAIAHSNVEIVELLLDFNANPNLRDDWGETPLFAAIRENKPDIVQLLLEHSANPNIRSKDGTNPLYLAQKSGNDTMVQMLLTAGATEMSKKEIWKYERRRRFWKIFGLVLI